jgi:two-component system, chemotaxis family, chemotaxis protein CheY
MQATLQRRTLLLIDDDLDALKLLSKALGTGYNLITKHDGAEAVQWLQSGNMPDLIITDGMMPNMDGLEFIKLIRGSRTHRHTPVVVISGNSDVRFRIKFLQLGADDFIAKPAHPEELVLRVNNIFRRMSRTQETQA